jgi:hypothetical protein
MEVDILYCGIMKKKNTTKNYSEQEVPYLGLVDAKIAFRLLE